MEIANAIAKVRFASARPQRVQLHKSDDLQVEMLCMEPGQQIKTRSGQWVYYVVTGKAAVTSGKETAELPTGQSAATAPDETHTIANADESRLICLAVGRAT